MAQVLISLAMVRDAEPHSHKSLAILSNVVLHFLIKANRFI